MNGASTVLVVTGPADVTADAVIARLRQREATVVRMDTGDFPQRLSLSATMTDRRWHGQIRTAEAAVGLADIRSVYYRRPTRFTFPEQMSPPDSVFAAAEARHGFGGTLAALEALWVNDPSFAARAEYKPLQLRVAADAGLSVPPTLVTSHHPSAVEFAAAYGPIVCKPLSSLVLGDENGRPLITYTTRVDVAHIDPLHFGITTNLLQRWVTKVMDCRVTMVGRSAFAAAVRADSHVGHVDWRADYSSLTYSPIEVPAAVTAGMSRYLAILGLHSAAFDFGIDHDGRWWFYEANPNGEWLWIERETGLDISAAFAELLVEGTAH